MFAIVTVSFFTVTPAMSSDISRTEWPPLRVQSPELVCIHINEYFVAFVVALHVFVSIGHCPCEFFFVFLW